MLHRLRRAFVLILALGLCAPALAVETKATAAWVYDVTTHTVLMDKNGDDPDKLLAAGVTHFVVGINGAPTGYDLAPLRELVAWRDGLS